MDKFDKSTLVLEGATLQIRTLYHSCALDTLVSSLLLSGKVLEGLSLGACKKNTPHCIRILTNSPLAYWEAFIMTTSLRPLPLTTHTLQWECDGSSYGADLALEVQDVVKVLIDLLGLAVLLEEAAENALAAHPLHLGGKASVGSTPPLTGASVATLSLGLVLAVDTGA